MIFTYCKSENEEDIVDLNKFVQMTEAVVFMPQIINKDKNISHGMQEVMDDPTNFSNNFYMRNILVGQSKKKALEETFNSLLPQQNKSKQDHTKRLEVISFQIQQKFNSLQEAFRFFDP
jgi:hypothetical protein